MKLILSIISLFTLSVSAQTPFPILNPANPDSVVIIGNANGAPRRIYSTDLLKNKADKTATISINGTTQTIGSNPSFSVSGSGGSSSFNLADTSNGIKVFNVLKYGAKGDGTTDDTQGIQAAINAAVKDTFSSYGVVYFPYTGNDYMIKGPIVTTAANGKPVNSAQLYIPDLSPNNARIKPGGVKLVGQVSPNYYIQTAVQIGDISNATKNGVVLHSTDTLHAGSVLGSAYTTFPTFGNFNYTKLDIENLGFVVASKRPDGTNIPAKMTAINAYNIAMFGGDNIFVKTETDHHDAQAVPPASTAYGIKMPHGGNWAYSVLNNAWAQGFYSGYLLNEHFVSSGMLNSTFNVNGIELESTPYHAIKIPRLMAWLNTYHIKLPASGAKFQIDQLDTEDDINSGKWWSTIYDVYQPDGSLNNTGIANYGTVLYSRFIYDGGYILNTTFTKSANVSPNVYADPINKRYLDIGGQSLGTTYNIGSKDTFSTRLLANNLPRLIVTSAGKVNMGTSPSGMTEVGDVNVSGSFSSTSFATAPTVRAGTSVSSGSYALQVKPTTTNQDPFFVITGSGNGLLKGTAAGNLLVGNAGEAASTFNNIVIQNGGAPSSSLTNSAILWTQQNTAYSSSVLHSRSSSGIVNYLSGEKIGTKSNHDLKFAANDAELAILKTNGNLLIGTSTDDATNKLQISGNIKSNQYRLSALNVEPVSSTDTGTTGEIRVTSNFIYVCTAPNTWVRTALTTW